MSKREEVKDDIVHFLEWLRERGFELAKNRQMLCGDYVWIPISDPIYTVEIEDIVKAYVSEVPEKRN